MGSRRQKGEEAGKGMLREAHISRLERRYGIPSEAARKLAEEGVLASVDAAEIARLCGRRDPGEGGGILIRYPNAEEMFAVRLDVPRVRPDGKVQKYDRPAGLPPRPFVPPGLDLEGAAEVWITEGELKALAGTVRGLPAAALAGVYNWRRDADQNDPAEVAAKFAGPGGKAPDPEALIDDLRRDWSGKTVVLLYDSDITREHDPFTVRAVRESCGRWKPWPWRRRCGGTTWRGGRETTSRHGFCGRRSALTTWRTRCASRSTPCFSAPDRKAREGLREVSCRARKGIQRLQLIA